jgi:hypothetical protein
MQWPIYPTKTLTFTANPVIFVPKPGYGLSSGIYSGLLRFGILVSAAREAARAAIAGPGVIGICRRFALLGCTGHVPAGKSDI